MASPCRVSGPQTVLKPLYSVGLWLPVIMMAPSASRCLRRIIEHWSGHRADVGDVAAGGEQAFQQRVAEARGAEAAIAAQVDVFAAAAALQVGAQPASQQYDIGAQEFRFGDASDVVLAEDGRLEHITILALTRTRHRGARTGVEACSHRKLNREEKAERGGSQNLDRSNTN